jgi:pyridoxine 5-phosphate synthase
MIIPDILLGVNVDHVATLRQARQAFYPEPIAAAILAEQAGADGITVHLREDRRHIQPRDVSLLKEVLHGRLNLEMAVTDDMVGYALTIQPQHCCFVPEKREELTTEGGLDVISHAAKIQEACELLKNKGIIVSIFIDPNQEQIDAALTCGAQAIEIHTGEYANASNPEDKDKALKAIESAARYAKQAGFIVNAGHGLDYQNVKPIAAIPEIRELNIGHSIVARAVLSGMKEAVTDMKRLMREGRESHFV